MIKSINPSNLEVVQTYQTMQPTIVKEIIDSANVAFEKWKATSFSKRSSLMLNAARVLKKKKEE